MPKLFTKTDLERCARIAMTQPDQDLPSFDVEAAIQVAVERVAGDGPQVYTYGQVQQLIHYAAEFGAEAALKLL